MTSRVDQIWTQALDQAVPETWSALTPVQLDQVRAKFAELLIQECADLFKNTYVSVEHEHGHASVVASDYIKRHFNNDT